MLVFIPVFFLKNIITFFKKIILTFLNSNNIFFFFTLKKILTKGILLLPILEFLSFLETGKFFSKKNQTFTFLFFFVNDLIFFFKKTIYIPSITHVLLKLIAEVPNFILL